MAPVKKSSANPQEIDRLALQLVKDPHSKVFMPLAEEYIKAGMWQEAAAVLEDGLKYYPGFITAMVTLGRAYDQLGQATKAKAILEEAVKLSPENLRAHRTLVKIYAAQGLAEAALRCCAVILAVNPQDEEALSVQAQLRPSMPQGPPANSPAAPISVVSSRDGSLVSPVSGSASAKPIEPSIVDPVMAATPLMETPLERISGPSQEPCEEANNPPHPISESALPAPSQVISQLETWLHSIQSRRRDRDRTDHEHSASS